MTEISRQDRISGCLFAGAIGDAIGSAFEGKRPPSQLHLPSRLSITDDTQLTIATCESLVEQQRIDPASIAERFVVWFRARRITGIGASTLKALTELDAGGHWALVGAIGERSAGNGAAMRIAPLAFFLDPDDAGQRQAIRDVCRITHRNDEAYVGALALLRTIRHVAAGNELQREFLLQLTAALPDSRVRDRLLAVHAHAKSVAEYAARFATTGYVVDAVPCAILAAVNAGDLLVMLSEIIQCGGDTDTISSMAAQIFGALHGLNHLPTEILDRIDCVDPLREIVARLSILDIAATP